MIQLCLIDNNCLTVSVQYVRSIRPFNTSVQYVRSICPFSTSVRYVVWQAEASGGLSRLHGSPNTRTGDMRTQRWCIASHIAACAVSEAYYRGELCTNASPW